MVKINPEVLIWARETAGLSPEEAAQKLGLSTVEKLQGLERGEHEPSSKQLSNMAAKYRRPLLSFYLAKPPARAPRGEDFRTLPEGEGEESEALLSALVRDVQVRQQLVRAALEETEEAKKLDFVASRRMADGAEVIVAEIKKITGADINAFRGQRNVTEAFAYLRGKVESAGVFVLLLGNLGTHHTNIDTKVFRGFALADEIAPFIVINETDSRAAWSFTLIHELTHILLGQTGISGYDSEQRIEKFCDEVAGDFFLDFGELPDLVEQKPSFDELLEGIGEFSTLRKVSRKMVAYNLAQLGLIGWADYRKLTKKFDEDRHAAAADRERGEGGPNYYIVRRHRIGAALVAAVRRVMADGALTTTKAGKVLGVKPTAVGRLIEAAQ